MKRNELQRIGIDIKKAEIFSYDYLYFFLIYFWLCSKSKLGSERHFIGKEKE